MTDRLARIMHFQRKAAEKEDHPNLMIYMDENDFKNWFFLATNLPKPFTNGEYIFQLIAPDEFPKKPPIFHFLTPNGVFQPGGKICISIGEFHANDAPGKHGSSGWRASLGMIGFAREVINGMIDPDHLGGGIRILNNLTPKKKELAYASRDYNYENFPELMKEFDIFKEEHSNLKVSKLYKMWTASYKLYPELKRNKNISISEYEKAFGEENWEIISDTFSKIHVNKEIKSKITNILIERNLYIRHVLVLAFHSYILSEYNKEKFNKAYELFLSKLPNVCGSACAELIPNALKKYPEKFIINYDDIINFLCMEDIDEKAKFGKIIVERITNTSDDLEDYISELLEEL